MVYLTIIYVFLYSQIALGHDHVEDLSKHSSQVDAAKGFGGKFGVQKDRVDKVFIYYLAHITHLREKAVRIAIT